MHMHFKQHVINRLNCLPLQLLHSNALIMIIKFYLIFRYNNMMLIQVLIAYEHVDYFIEESNCDGSGAADS